MDIEERPTVISGSKRYADWEANLIHGGAGSGFLLSVYERKNRIGRLHLLPDRGSAETMKEIVMVPARIKSQQQDHNTGHEFSKHESVNELLECKKYFC